jgi:hypothetical protein
MISLIKTTLFYESFVKVPAKFGRKKPKKLLKDFEISAATTAIEKEK